MNKSSIAELRAGLLLAASGPGEPAPSPRRWSRRQWIGGALAAGGALSVEVASLAGGWDHRSRTAAASSPLQPLDASVPRLTHVGHSCHLIEMSGQRWLTDPWFFNPAFGSLTHDSALGPEAIGPLDGIFISHRHADHFDPHALSLLDKRARVWTADPSLLGTLRELGFSNASESQPWQTLQSGSIALSFTPAVHDVPQHSLVLLGTDARVLFCGDTGPHAFWSEIRRRYRPTTALLPCDGTALRWEPRQIMNPSEAASAALALGCPQILQTHADSHYTDPVARYLLSSNEAQAVQRFRRALAEARESTGAPGHAEGSPTPGEQPQPELVPLAIGETRRLFSGNSTTL